jgi:ribosome-associated translation inhibitor RaiA
MTTENPATVAESLQVEGDLTESDVKQIVQHWSKLDSRMRSFSAGSVDLKLFVKDRDTKSQQVTLDAKIDGHSPLVATSSSSDLDHALNEVRDELIRQMTDMKNRSEPRNNRHLRDTTRG